jgi:hypothetical protein
MSDLADRFRREGLADAVVLLVLSRTHPQTTAEEWGRILGLQQHEVRAAIERFRAKHTPKPLTPAGRKPYRNTGRKMLSLDERRQRDQEIRLRRERGESVAVIALSLGLTVTRIQQILAKASA